MFGFRVLTGSRLLLELSKLVLALTRTNSP